MKNKLKPVHAIHLLLYAPTGMSDEPEPIIGRTRLMKMVFLFEKELAKYFEDKVELIDFNFEAYDYGPFSKKVYEAIDFLESREIIEIFPVPLYKANRYEMGIDRILMSEEENLLDFQETETYESEGYKLTKAGKAMMTLPEKWFSWENLDDEKKNALRKFKTTLINTPLTDVLRYVYSKYPKYAEKSVIYEKLFSTGV